MDVGAVRFTGRGYDGTVRFWDPATMKERRSFRAHLLQVHVLAYAPDGRRLTRPEKLSTEGLPASLASLLATCPAPKETVPLQQATPQNSAAK